LSLLISESAHPVDQAVLRSKPASWDGVLERLFALAFRGLVYPQIWEDPVVDMRALALAPGARLIAIASGGCNVMSYLAAEPAEVVAVDLNPAHVALLRLKLAAAQHLPGHGDFYRFFGAADDRVNVIAYERFLRDRLDAETRAYWDGRDLSGRRRISLFSRGFYRAGLFGRFIGFGHFVARLYGVELRRMTEARTLEEQRAFFEETVAPLFEKRFVRWATANKLSLFGLGIPPAQYEALAGAGADGIAGVLRQRLGRLAGTYSLADNYFAWQAFARRYAGSECGPLPPYLQRQNHAAIRERASRVRVVHRSFTDHLRSEPGGSFDGYVLLDAQDWMTDLQLNRLWSEITRTARPGARVIFRTAAEPSILPGRVAPAVLDRWDYLAEESRGFTLEDRSCTYGGFHLYRLGRQP
jgi:S-adenosylmethionine-diacylglycerol 3-amino-3-carboxypropyl transferase